MTRARWSCLRAFTLIEVLVVVAIIALLIAILLPSLSRAKEQAKRATCAAHLHQLMCAVATYSNENQGLGPRRGWFSYTVSETAHEARVVPASGSSTEKVLTNLGLLYSGWIGKQQDLLYCPSTYATTRDRPADYDSPTRGGWKTVWDPLITYTYGGLNYIPILGVPRSPNFRSYFVLPNDPSWWNSDFQAFVTDWEKQHPGLKYKLPLVPVIATDWIIGNGGANGQVFAHLNGLNAAYSDGHVRYHQQKVVDGMTSGSQAQYEIWHSLSMKQ